MNKLTTTLKQIDLFYIRFSKIIHSLLICTVLAIFLFFVPKTFLINLKTYNKNKAGLFYNSGSLVLQQDGVIDQYLTRRKSFTTDYLTSLYEPAFMLGETIYSAYRPKATQIKYDGKTYFLYISETGGYMSENESNLPAYESNMIVGPSLGLFGYENSVYNYTWGEIINSYLKNQINVKIECSDKFFQSKCKNKLDSLNLVADGSKSNNSFNLSYDFNFGETLENEEKIPIAALIVPEDFYLCPTKDYNYYNCITPVEKEKTPYLDVPIIILDNESKPSKKITIKDLNFSKFYLNNFKIDDFYTLKTSNPIELGIKDEYFLVHKSDKIALKISPINDKGTYSNIQKQFNSIRFFGSSCFNKTCNITINLEIITKD